MVLDVVERYCKEKNLSVSAFEQKCGLTNGTISNWKRRKNNPSLSAIKKISDATKIPINKLVG